MARIPTYEIDSVINDLDMLLGTDYNDNEFTKNFTLSGIAEYVIDKLIEPNAVQSTVPVFRNTGDVQGGNATRITSSIINQNIYPNGTNISISGTLDVEKKAIIKGGEGESGILQLNCSENSHGIKIQGPPHSAAASYTMILPNDMGTAGKQLTTDGVDKVYWADPEDDNLDIAADTNTGSIDLDTQALTISGGTLLSTTVNPDGGQTIIVDHDAVARTNNASAVTLNFGDTLDALVDEIVTDPSGHIQTVASTTYTLPSTPVTSIVAGTNVTISPTNGIGDVTVNATNQIPGNNVIGTGTTNKITLWTDASQGEIGDSIISAPSPFLINIGGSLEVGSGHTTSTTNCLTSGENNSIQGNFSVAFGADNSVTGNRSGGLGANNIVAGGQVWATGDGNNVGINILNVGGNIVTAGFNNTVKSGNSCVVGSSNNLTNTQELQTVNTNFALGSGNDINDVSDGIALGFNNTINNTESGILGKNNTTNASSTYVIGKQNSLSSDDDYAFGFNNTIGNSANGAMALGHANSIDGPTSYAIGLSNDLNSQNDYAFGFNNTVGTHANLAMAIGQNNDLEGSQSYAFGRNLKDGGEDNTVIIGRFNVTPTATGRIVFGTGFSDTGRRNAIEIQAGTNNQSGLLFKALQASNSYADDAAAAAGGVELGELYRNGNIVQIRIV